MTAFPHTLSELKIGNVTIPNRIARPAHVTMLGLGDPSGISERLIDYHVARAKGSVGLTILEICSGHPSSPATLNSFNPALGDGYKRLVEAVEPHGMKLFQQIWHGAQNAFSLRTRTSISKLEGDAVELKSIGGATEKVKANGVVIVAYGGAPRDDFVAAQANGRETYIIGDAKSPRFLETAMKEGRETAIAI